MKIAIGADHAGFAAKEEIKTVIKALGHAVIGDEKTAALSRQHNDANVFCAGSRVMPVVKIAESLKVWLQTPFEGGRHQNRVNKISAIEKSR